MLYCAAERKRERADDPRPSQLAADVDDSLYTNTLNNPHYVFRKLLSDKTDHRYNLKPRRRPLSLTVKTDYCNFIHRLLFTDIY